MTGAWRDSDWVRPERTPREARAHAAVALASIGAIIVLLVALSSCAAVDAGQAVKVRAFWCDPTVGRVPTYAALVRVLKPDVGPQVMQAVAAAEAACASPELPIDVLVAKAVLAGLVVQNAE